MKVFVAGLACEVNSFSPRPTDLAAFEATFLRLEGVDPVEGTEMFTGPLGAAMRRPDWRVVTGPFAVAQPGGPVVASVYEGFRDLILESLSRAGKVDAVLLALHGAMMAEGQDDCEGDILASVRRLVGRDTVIGVLLDPHCHLTPAMVEAADIIHIIKEYPHIDVAERACELVDLVDRAVRGEIRPVMTVSDCGIVDIFHTFREPMRGFVDRMNAAEGHDGILSISLVHGFPWGDQAALGAKVLVVTDGQGGIGERTARRLAAEIRGLRGTTASPILSVAEAVAEVARSTTFPIVLADGADNPGGGAPSDTTHILHALRAADIVDVAAALIHDPETVRQALVIGEGGEAEFAVGGKGSFLSGSPFRIRARVARILRGATQPFSGTSWPLGDVVLLQGEGVSLVVSSVRSQCFAREVFDQMGLDPVGQRVLLVKSSQHFLASFGPIAAKVLYPEAPGVVTRAITTLPYRKRPRPLWPFEEIAEGSGT